MIKIIATHTPTRRGFTLMETAIILLATSFVVGGIWIAAQHVMDNYRVSRATQQMTKIVQNVREYYMNAQVFPYALGNITTNLDNLNMIPTEMRRTGVAGGAIDHPMNNTVAGGSLLIYGEGCATGDLTASCFRVRFSGLTTTSCVKLLQALPVTDADLGMAGFGAQNTAVGTTGAGAKWSVPALVTASTITTTWCTNAGATNEADFDFRLRH